MALQEAGVDSLFYSRDNFKTSAVRKLSSKALTFMQGLNTRKEFGLITPMSVPILDLSEVRALAPDVIHVHNWYNLLSLGELVLLSEIAPLAFTMHDQRLFTGGCHNTLDCSNFKRGCDKCPGVMFGQKQISEAKLFSSIIFSRLKDYAIICPSMWMRSYVTESVEFEVRNLEYIPNIIPSPQLLEKALKSSQVFRILMVSAQLNVKLKGVELLLEAIRNMEIRRIDNYSSVEVIFVGSGSVNVGETSQGVSVQILPLQTSMEVAQLMQECHVLVVPSSSENSPNVIGEAQLSGLLVCASNVGGIPELIEDGETGLLFARNPKSILEALYKVINLDQSEASRMVKKAKDAAVVRYDTTSITKRTVEVYKELLRQRQA